MCANIFCWSIFNMLNHVYGNDGDGRVDFEHKELASCYIVLLNALSISHDIKLNVWGK